MILKKIEKDLWIVYEGKCPHCLETSPFWLRQHRGVFRFFGINLFDYDRLYQLRCKLCGYFLDIEPEELFPAARARRLLEKHQTGSITAGSYWETLDRLSFPTLEQIRGGSDDWKCASCGESSPESINECWSCNAPRSASKGDEKIEDFEPPPLHFSVRRHSTNTWER